MAIWGLGAPASALRFQHDHGDLAARLVLVLPELWVLLRLLGVEGLTLLGIGDPGRHLQRVVADLDLGVGIGLDVVEPVGGLVGPALGSEDHVVVAFLPVHERVDPRRAALGTGVVEEQDRLAGKEPADLACIGAELLDDRCVPVVRVRRHDCSSSATVLSRNDHPGYLAATTERPFGAETGGRRLGWLDLNSFSRRTLLKGMAAGAGLAVAGPAVRFGSRAAPGAALRAPGSLPFPNLPPGTDTLPQIEHIVVLMMENHSFDNYFGVLGRGDGFQLGPDGLPANTCPDSAGRPVRAYHAPDLCQNHGGVSQSWNASHRAYDGGRNDGFVVASSTQAMSYFTDADLPYYDALARAFPVCDRFFSSVMAKTYPNRRFLMAGTALGQVDDVAPALSDPPPPNGTIFDRLEAHGISWKNYFVDLPTTGLFPYQLTKFLGRILPVADFFVDAALGKAQLRLARGPRPHLDPEIGRDEMEPARPHLPGRQRIQPARQPRPRSPGAAVPPTPGAPRPEHVADEPDLPRPVPADAAP